MSLDGTLQVKASKKAKDDKAAGVYQKLSQLEHVLLRPDSYIGSIAHVPHNLYIFSEGKLEFNDVMYCPALIKLVDEILVNASDRQHDDLTMKNISVTVDETSGVIAVKNDGAGIPVVNHPKYGNEPVPQIIFGNFLTGQNFDDTQERLKGGRNGYGAKLVNAWSKSFTVTIVDPERQKQYKQKW